MGLEKLKKEIELILDDVYQRQEEAEEINDTEGLLAADVEEETLSAILYLIKKIEQENKETSNE